MTRDCRQICLSKLKFTSGINEAYTFQASATSLDVHVATRVGQHSRKVPPMEKGDVSRPGNVGNSSAPHNSCNTDLHRYIHQITRTRSSVRPEEAGGGVLADEMGMGKTLSTLALMMRTLEDGQRWAEIKRSQEHSSGKIQRHTHSTLVIVPSARELHFICRRRLS